MSPKRESLRAEAARRGVTVYRVRADRARAAGLPVRVGVGKARSDERSLRDRSEGLPTPVRATSKQRYRYRYWIMGVYSWGEKRLGVVDSSRRLTRRQIDAEVNAWFSLYDEPEMEDRYGDGGELPMSWYVDRITVT